jgi:outer membrane protein TolC
MRTLLLALCVPVVSAYAEDNKPVPPAQLTLSSYLEQVKTGSAETRAAIESIQSLELRVKEPEGPYSPEFYSEYHLFDNRTLPTNDMSPQESKGRQWKTGIRDQTTFGLKADAYFTSQRTTLGGVKQFPGMNFMTDYEQSSFGLNLQQSLWRDAFGEASRAERDGKKAAIRIDLLKQKFMLKNLLLRAENTYWSLVSYNQIVKLQEENVDRAKRLRDWMGQRAKMRLFDDVDAMQAEAAFQQRDLELQTSTNDRAAMLRQFNTLRGRNEESAETLAELPTSEFMLKTANDKSKRMSREDFQIVYEQAQASEAQSRATLSQLHPQLDLVGGIAGTGTDPVTSAAMNDASQGRHPSWSVGLQFSIPLDYSLISDIKHSYQAQKRAAADIREQARFNEERAWDDLLKQNREAQGIFERAISLEKLQTELVKRERQRLLNGRTTTFQSLTIEQNLALAQIARVRAQLGLLQLHNLIKQFEEFQ